MARIRLLPDNKSFEIARNQTILQASLRAGIPHTHACGGKGKCSTCRVMVLEGIQHCSTPTPLEEKMAESLGFCHGIRLACQTTVAGDIDVRRLVLDDQDIELIKEAKAEIHPGPSGQCKKVAILFADIRGFTAFAEKLSPYDVIHVLNRYFHRMEGVITQNGGIVDAYLGDGLMALFGLEDPMAAVLRAVRAGIAMLEEVEKLNPYVSLMYRKSLQIGIGVHYGEVVVGRLGGKIHHKVTAIGDAVNLASRIESANKQTGTRFLISEDAYREIKDQIRAVNRCSLISLPGKTGRYTLYEILGLI